jgi:hypothetical protein
MPNEQGHPLDTSHVTVADIRLAWDIILPMLATVKANSAADWRPEDIYALCRNGEADLFLINHGRSGFYILQPTRCQYTLRKIVFVVAAFSSESDGIENCLPLIDQYARDHGAAYIEMFACRKGWERKGFDIQDIRYRRRP